LLLISNLCGDYDSETPEGRGANAAANVVKYIKEGKRISRENIKKFLSGELGVAESLENPAMDALATAYIPYMEVEEHSAKINLNYGMAFATVYINLIEEEKNAGVTPQQAGPNGEIIDQIDNSGRITPGKFLAWLIFQDCVDVYNGVISPQEASKAFEWGIMDPQFVIEKLREIYSQLNLKEKEKSFVIPEPVRVK
jgi:hypothetical protein